jgi:hypothetical protein
MKRGRLIAAIALVFAVVSAIAYFWGSGEEPVYQGKRLSSWIDEYDWAPKRRNEAERAIRQIGTNALPTLVSWIKYEEPVWRTELINRLEAVGSSAWVNRMTLGLLTRKARIHRMAMSLAGRHAREAGTGFQVLGTAAHSAVPDLAALLANKSFFASQNAMYALANISGQKVVILTQGLTNTDAAARIRAAKAIGFWGAIGPKFGDDPAAALPSLTDALNDSDQGVRAAASNSLRLIAPQAGQR